MALEISQEVVKVIRIHLLGIMDIYTKFHGSQMYHSGPNDGPPIQQILAWTKKHAEMRLDIKFGTVILSLLRFMLLYSESQTAFHQRDEDEEEEEGMHWHGASVLEYGSVECSHHAAPKVKCIMNCIVKI